MTKQKLCICCQTLPVNPWIGSFCSRVCETLWTRIDLQFTSAEAIKKIALAKHEQLANKN